MNFEQALDNVLDMLQRRGRVSCRALMRQFELDQEFLDDIKHEIIEVHRLAVEEDGGILVWTGSPGSPPESSAPSESLEHTPSATTPELPEARSPGAERRQLTVMFCDLVGSTALSGQFDPEDLGEIIRAFQDCCAGSITRFDGYIARYMGDGMLVYFGYPSAHEDAAERALRVSLDIINAVDKLEPRPGLRLQVRIGVATGQVVVGETIGSGGSQEQAVLGETPNLAARLQGLAEPNSVVIAPSTRRLAGGGFEYADLGEHSLKGFTEPVHAWRVVREQAMESRFAAAHPSGSAPLVGRDQELNLILDRWSLARSGEGQVVLLSGEAGIGKSRITQALRECLTEQHYTLLLCQCSPHYINTALYPFLQRLERGARFEREDSPDVRLDKLEALLTGADGVSQETLALLAALLTIPCADRYPPLDLNPQRQKERSIQALIDVILQQAAAQPVLLILEDAHWLDPTSLELLQQLIDQIPDARVMVLVTFRPEFVPPRAGHGNTTLLALNRLGREQCRALVRKLTRDKDLPDAVLDQILDDTDGVPLFVEELTKTVLESGLLKSVGDHYEVSGPLPPRAIPSTLQDSLMARLDRLAPVKEVAQLGAVIGREFSYRLLAQVAPLRDDALRDALAQLVEAELIFRRGRGDDVSYVFKHALVQDTAYQSLLRSRRQQFHQRIAQVLEQQFAQTVEQQPELLAHHYTQAGLAAQAVPYWQQAGQRALERAANLEAIAHLTRGLELLETLPETPERDRQELHMQNCLGPAYMAIKGWAAVEVEQACRRAAELSDHLGDAQQAYAAQWGLWTNYFLRGQMDNALATARETLRMASETDNPILHVSSHHAVGYTQFFRAEYTRAREFSEAGLTRFDLSSERALVQMFQFSSSVCNRMILGSSLWVLGHPEQGSEYVEQALELARELDHLPTRAYALAAGCYFHQPAGNAEWVKEKSEILGKLGRDEQFLLWLQVATIFHGWAVAVEGDRQRGLVEAEQGLAGFRATGTSIIMPQVMTMLGETYWRVGRHGDALDTLEQGMSEARDRNEHHMEPELYRLKAEILLDMAMAGKALADGCRPDVEQAEACFQQALTLAREQQALMFELRAASGLCRLWREQGQLEPARQLLAGVYGRFTEGWDTPDLREAHALLEQLQS